MGRPIDSDRVGYGKNRDLGTWRDDRYVRCSRCGFICHLDRDSRSRDGDRRGWGIKFEQSVANEGWFEDGWFSSSSNGWFVGGDVQSNVIDPVVTGGCPQCGTFLYDK